MKTFPKTLQPYIAVGRNIRNNFEGSLDDFFADLDHHAYYRGQPGIGKTHIVKAKAKKYNIPLLTFDGGTTQWAFSKMLAVYLYQAGWPSADAVPGIDFEIDDLPHIVIHLDDVGTIFDQNFIDVLKIALEQNESDKLVYGKSLAGQFKSSEKFEQEAIANFRSQEQAGFTVRFYGKVKFIFTMNHKLATQKDVEAGKKTNKSQKMISNMENEAALYSRLFVTDIHLQKEELWGWLTDLMVNNNFLPDATKAQRVEMTMWMYENWENLEEKSLRTLQHLWRSMSKTKTRKGYDYKSRWYTLTRRDI